MKRLDATLTPTAEPVMLALGKALPNFPVTVSARQAVALVTGNVPETLPVVCPFCDGDMTIPNDDAELGAVNCHACKNGVYHARALLSYDAPKGRPSFDPTKASRPELEARYLLLLKHYDNVSRRNSELLAMKIDLRVALSESLQRERKAVMLTGEAERELEQLQHQLAEMDQRREECRGIA